MTTSAIATKTTGNDDPAPLVAVDLISPQPIIVARQDGFFMCRSGDLRTIGQALTSNETNDSALIQQLLAGCLFAAQQNRVVSEPRESEPSVINHVYGLCAAYHTTHATPPTLRRARDQFLALGDKSAADCAELKAVEETGHDRLALRDLDAFGLPATALVAQFVPKRSKALVDTFDALSLEAQPYGVFGYAYVLERLAMQHGQEQIDSLQTLAPAGVDITRCSRVHSAIGADLSHVQELVEFIAGLANPLRTQICRSLHKTATVMFDRYDDEQEKANLKALLDDWCWQPFVGVSTAADGVV